MTKIIIDIPQEVYESAKNGTLNEIQSMYICGSVVEGTPLPKGHGRLIILDEAKAKEYFTNFSFSSQDWISAVDISKAALKIITSDKENNDDNSKA